MSQTCIIVGMGHAAGQLAPSLRQNGWEGKIIMIGEEDMLPYHRPPLSKDYLLGKREREKLLIRPQASYEKLNVECRTNTRVTNINREAHTIEPDNGEKLSYQKLILATGSRVRKLNLPGSDLKNIFYVRNIADVMQIKAAVQDGGKAVIIGGGYIGLEAAAVLKQLGMEVTLLEAMDRILSRVTSPEMSAFFTRAHQEEGVKVLTNELVTEFKGETRIEEVICEDGTSYPADMVIVGIGILPNVELASEARLAVNDGILVNEHAQTEDPDIFAVGDCTSHFNEHYQIQCRLESVPNAMDQAKAAAATICGNPTAYKDLPWFWSDQFDIKLQIAGLTHGYDQIVIRGDMNEGRSFVIWYLKNGELIAADCVNRPREFMMARKIIHQRVHINEELLADETANLLKINN
ncbi:MAG: NAD(P)/FAD-dependent oxidoreductase [Bacteroidetes bacterium]|nr:NAD(P)/FAD-dependent oxidoreductase [Bacteroidota bacterium]